MSKLISAVMTAMVSIALLTPLQTSAAAASAHSSSNTPAQTAARTAWHGYPFANGRCRIWLHWDRSWDEQHVVVYVVHEKSKRKRVRMRVQMVDPYNPDQWVRKSGHGEVSEGFARGYDIRIFASCKVKDSWKRRKIYVDRT